MVLLVVSFLAGILTVLAPCVLPLLPIIIGGSVQGQKRNPYLITASLAASIILFTLVLKFSTALINIPQGVWSGISGVIIIVFGLISLFPALWDKISIRFSLNSRSEKILAESARKPNRWGDILIGASLGPVFSSCSPTYFLILATVLPRSLATGIVYLIAYAAGLCLILLLVSVLGQRFIRKAGWAANPNGWFKRGLGILFLLVGIFILTGTDKRLQTYLLEKGYFNITNIEQTLLQKAEKSISPSSPQILPTTTKSFPRYREIEQPSGFVNTTSITIGELVGKKVILVDFMTYSCINCIRTFPYLKAWYDKYKDQGLEIIGIHTPEFAFEKKLANVETALERYSISFPVVLDNDYATWGAYGNNYWPRKYLIDIDGHIVYDHIGEGDYDETEKKIQELLQEKMERDQTSTNVLSKDLVDIAPAAIQTRSPEVYFGSHRNESLANGQEGLTGEQTFSARDPFTLNQLHLDGQWNMHDEYAESKDASASIIYRYHAQHVFFVASSDQSIEVKILLDEKPVPKQMAGDDIFYKGEQSYIRIQEDRLYSLIGKMGENSGATEHLLKLEVTTPGLKAYTFTFG